MRKHVKAIPDNTWCNPDESRCKCWWWRRYRSWSWWSGLESVSRSMSRFEDWDWSSDDVIILVSNGDKDETNAKIS
jgi:hypothetical protein